MVSSSGYKNDLVCCTNINENIDTFVQIHDNGEYWDSQCDLFNITTVNIPQQTFLVEIQAHFSLTTQHMYTQISLNNLLVKFYSIILY